MAAFSRGGKAKPLTLLKSNIEAQRVFASLGEDQLNLDINEENAATIEHFVCAVYEKRRLSSGNDIRFQIFIDRHKPKKLNQSITCIKKFDGSSIPPCSRVLREKMKRTQFVVKRWFSSVEPFQPLLSPLHRGWTLENGK